MKKFFMVAAIIAVLGVVGHQTFATTTLSTAKVGFQEGAERGYVADGGSFDVESGGELDIESGGSLKLAGTTVSSDADELNILDGVTSDAGELNILDGVTADATELNLLDGLTATTTELNQKEAIGFLTDISGANSIEFAAPAAGDISSIKITLNGYPSGVGSITTITTLINGVAITDGTVGFGSTEVAYTKYTITPTGANSVELGDLIQVLSDGNPVNAVGVHAVVIIDL